jgi:N-acetyl-anhydromuramyl-L-alanine amidase AmpD
MKIIPSNNFTPGRVSPIKYGVIHTFQDADKESYHYIIERGGVVVQCVALKDTAWHCHESYIAIPVKDSNLDPMSVGIALIGEPTSKQYEVLSSLANDIESEVMKDSLGFIERWIGHNWISHVTDPEVFDWEIFNRERYRCKLINELTSTWKSVLSKEIEDSWSAGQYLRKGLWKIFH